MVVIFNITKQKTRNPGFEYGFMRFYDYGFGKIKL
jgi:hypothetical protein